MSGYEATAELRKQNITTPIVALSANVLQGERERCITVGFTDFLAKPAKAADILAVIQQLIPQRSREDGAPAVAPAASEVAQAP
jgi:CheY-like chemotaxis protein